MYRKTYRFLFNIAYLTYTWCVNRQCFMVTLSNFFATMKKLNFDIASFLYIILIFTSSRFGRIY